MQPRLLLKKFPLKPSVHSWDAIFPNIRPDSGTKISENFPGTKFLYVQIVGQKPWHKYAQIVGQKSLKVFWNKIVNFFGRHLWQYSGTKLSENFPVGNIRPDSGTEALAQIRPDSGTKIPENFLEQH